MAERAGSCLISARTTAAIAAVIISCRQIVQGHAGAHFADGCVFKDNSRNSSNNCYDYKDYDDNYPGDDAYCAVTMCEWQQ